MASTVSRLLYRPALMAGVLRSLPTTDVQSAFFKSFLRGCFGLDVRLAAVRGRPALAIRSNRQSRASDSNNPQSLIEMDLRWMLFEMLAAW